MVRKVSTSTMRDGSFPFGNGTGKPTLVRGHLPLKFQWITHTKRLRRQEESTRIAGKHRWPSTALRPGTGTPDRRPRALLQGGRGDCQEGGHTTGGPTTER